MELTALSSSALSASGRAGDDAITAKAKEFEALMLQEFLKPMFETAKTPSLFGGDGAEQNIFGSMLQGTYAEAIAERGGIGIADQVKAALISLQSDRSTFSGETS